MGPHEEFLELCAVSTSGDLTEEEQKKLQAHLAGCAECRQALREFEAAVDVGVPLLSSEFSAVPSEESVVPQTELARSVLLKVAAKDRDAWKLVFRQTKKKAALHSPREMAIGAHN